MLILFLVFIWQTNLSQQANVKLSQCYSLGISQKNIHTHIDQGFLNPFNILKAFKPFKSRNPHTVKYDESQISKTVNLPKNVWPSLPNVNEAGIERQERIQKYWEEDNVYPKLCENQLERLIKKRKTVQKALRNVKIIYDGPPYANGSPHFGHFLNKTIKDVFLRFFFLQGNVPIMVPGWDCHGMPIEHKILKVYNREDVVGGESKKEEEQEDKDEEMEEEKVVSYIDDNSVFTYKGLKEVRELLKREKEEEEERLNKDFGRKRWSIFVRERCKEFAYRSIKKQMAYFKKSGVWAFWNDYYATYHSPYERLVMDTFINLKEKSLIYQANLPQVYSSKTKSVLADSEILQKTEKVMTTYVSFPVDLESCKEGKMKELRGKMDESGIRDLKLVAWTTTAYTLPGNKGLAVDRRGKYSLYRRGEGLYIMNDCVLNNKESKFWSEFEKIESLEDLKGNEVDQGENEGEMGPSLEDESKSEKSEEEYFIEGHELNGVEYNDPIYGNKFRVYSEGFVDADKGTGIVHLSPAHGFEDFNCIKKDPRFSQGSDNEGFHFCNLFDKDENFLPNIHKELDGTNIREFDEIMLYSLVGDNLLKVEYKDMEVDIDWRCENKVHTRLTKQYCLSLPPREEMVKILKEVKITPVSGERYLTNIIRARNRDWCLSRQRFWGTPIPFEGDKKLFTDFSPDYGLSEKIWMKSQNILDIIDVWFESALSRNFSLEVANMLITRMLRNKEIETSGNYVKLLEKSPKYVIEGQDQHRGWFQSLIIVTMLTQGKLKPFDHLFSHLFVKLADQKLSKSKMNVDDQDLLEMSKREDEKVKVNKDEDVMRRSLQLPADEYNKTKEETSKIRSTVRPGEDLMNLMMAVNSQHSQNNSVNYGVKHSVNQGENGENYGVKHSPDTQDVENEVSERTKSKGNTSNSTYFNVDVLRTLVCSNDFLTHDLELSRDSIRAAKHAHKKIINCFKYLSSVLVPENYDPNSSGPEGNLEQMQMQTQTQTDNQTQTNSQNYTSELSIPEESDYSYADYSLNGLDLYFLNLAYSLARQCKDNYETGNFFKVLNLVERFTTTLSNVYFSYVKNFLYILPRNHQRNKAIRFVLNKVLYILLKVLGPIMPHLCEDLYLTLNPKALSLFEERWPVKPDLLRSPNDEFGVALTVRKELNKEHAHSNKFILRLEENKLTNQLRKVQDLGVDLRLIFNVAGVEFCNKLSNSQGSGFIRYSMVDSGFRKCKRCWLFKEDVSDDGLCGRCLSTLEEHLSRTLSNDQSNV